MLFVMIWRIVYRDMATIFWSRILKSIQTSNCGDRFKLVLIMTAATFVHTSCSSVSNDKCCEFSINDRSYCELLNSEIQVLHNEVKSLTEIINILNSELKKLAASSMLHEAKVAYYAFDVAARFLIWLFMPFLWLR